MDMPPPAMQGRRASTVVERKLDELCACLDGALSSRKRGPDAESRLLAEIKAKTDFLRSLLAAEAECHGGAPPEHLAEAEARFAVLEATFRQWARRAAACAPKPVEEAEVVVGEPEEDEETDCSESTCSCTGSCQETAAAGNAVEASKEVASGAIADGSEAAETRGEAASGAVAKKREAMGTREEVMRDAIAKKREAVAETRRRTWQPRWWMQSAAWCGAAGVAIVVAIGLAVEFAAVAHHNVNVHVVPT
ncbi:hypothetical protein U9M48_033414 [Paspalum notatum var. saurae]|uniref:DUF7610 domain-containing protein n=1 Tax=Paspalum notatum var. saurae TaxID=547442 RepID=A0AAQ3U9N0_PASNO